LDLKQKQSMKKPLLILAVIFLGALMGFAVTRDWGAILKRSPGELATAVADRYVPGYSAEKPTPDPVAIEPTPTPALPPRSVHDFNEKELAYIQRAKEKIPELRMGTAELLLFNEEGTPLPAGSTVEYKLRRHAFGFGMNDGPLPTMDRARSRLQTNLCTEQIDWRSMRSERDAPMKTEVLTRFFQHQWLQKAGFSTVFHTILWNIPHKVDGDRVEKHLPNYAMDISDFDLQTELMREHVRLTAEYTQANDYDVVNVWNEPINSWSNGYQWEVPVLLEVIKEMCNEFRSVNSESEIMLNMGSGLTHETHIGIHEFLVWCRENNVELDRVGLQAYYNGYIFNYQPTHVVYLEEFAEEFEKYSTSGYKLDITEFCLPSTGTLTTAFHWNEEKQADFAEAVYTLAFGTENFESITWFNGFMRDAPLIQPGKKTSPLVERLGKLIDSWTTKEQGILENPGAFTFHGYGGIYAIEATLPKTEKTLYYEFDLPPRETVHLSLSPKKKPVPAPAGYEILGPLMDDSLALKAQWMPLDKRAKINLNVGDHPTTVTAIFPRFNLVEPEPDTWVCNYQHGYFFPSVPEGASMFRCVIELEADDASVIPSLQVFTHGQRFYVEDIEPGRYLLSFPVVPGEEISILHWWWGVGKRSVMTMPRYL
jgi:hypothetical protein